MAYPLIYSSLTGRWEEVTPETSEEAFGIPIGPPVQYSSDIHAPPGGLEVPGNEPPDYYNPGERESLTSTGRKPQLWASTEEGVPQGYDPDEERRRHLRQEEEPEDRIPLEGEEGTPSGGYNPGLPPGLVLNKPPSGALPPGMTLDKLPKGEELNPQEYPVSYNGDLYPTIAEQRKQWVDEIRNNPKLYEYLAAVVSQEAGGPDDTLGVVEALFNRTQQRKSTITKQIFNGFYGPVNTGRVDRIVRQGVEPWMYKQFNDALNSVANGSDLIEGRTDQGQIDEIKGPKIRYGKEYFGYMDGDPSWSIQHQRNKGEPGGAYRKPITPGLDADTPITPGLIPLPPGLVMDKEPKQALPPGLVMDKKPQGLPPGMTLDKARGQGGAVAAQEQPPETVKTPLVKMSASVARQLGLERWIDQDTGAEVRRGHLAGTPKESLPVRSAINEPAAGEPSLGINIPTTRAEAAAAEAEGHPLPEALLPKEQKPAPVTEEGKKDLRPTVPISTEIGHGFASRIGEYSRVLEEKGIAPALDLVESAVQSVAPGTELANFISGIKNNYKDYLSEKSKKEAGLKFDEKLEKRSIPGEVAGSLARISIDLPIITATAGRFPLPAGAGIMAKLGHGAGAMTIPGAMSGMEAANEVKAKGGSVGTQAQAFITTMLESQAMGAVPLSQSSAAKSVLGRLGGRAVKGAIGFPAIEETIRDVKNVWASATGGEHIPYDPRRTIVSAGTGAGLAMAVGGREAPKAEAPRLIDIIERAETREAFGNIRETMGEVGGKAMAASQTARTPTEADKHQTRIAEINKEIEAITQGKDKLSDDEVTKVKDLLNEAMDLSLKVQEAEATPQKEGTAEKPTEAKEPVEPTHDIRTTKSKFVWDKDGNRGEVTGEKDGKLEVTWDKDDTKATVNEGDVRREPVEETVNKNTVIIVPSKKGSGARVIHYDEKGKKVSDTNHALYSEAVTKAEKLTKDNNLSGYFDANDNFVRERGEPKETSPEVVAEKPPEEAEGTTASVPTMITRQMEADLKAAGFSQDQINKMTPAQAHEHLRGTTKPPGMTPEQQAAYEAAAAPVPETFFDKLEFRIRKAAGRLGIAVPDLRKTKVDYWDLRKQYKTAPLDELTQRFKDYKIGRQTVEQIVNSNFPAFKVPVRVSWSDKYPGERSQAGSAAAVTIDSRSGLVTVTLNPRIFLADLEGAMIKGSMGEGAKYGTKWRDRIFYDTLAEEMIHVAQNQATWNEWRAMSGDERKRYIDKGAPKFIDGFTVYKAERFGVMIDKIEGAKNGLSGKQQEAIDQAMVDAYNAYFATMPDVPNPDLGFVISPRHGSYKIYDRIRRRQTYEDHYPTVMIEITRQMLQYYRDGRITEQAMAETTAPVRQAYQQAVNGINEFLKGMFKEPTPEGTKIKEAISEELDAWNKILEDKDLRKAQKNHSVIEPYTEGTPEFNEFIGKSVTRNTVLYHVHPRDTQGFTRPKDFGTHVGTFRAAADRFHDKTKGVFNRAIGFVTFPLYGKLETPMYLKDHIDWVPGNVAADARERGYITKQEIDALVARDGRLSHANLKELFQKKGFDSIAYINQREGKRMIHGEELENWLKSSKIERQSGGGYVIIDSEGQVIGGGRAPDEAWGNARTNLETYPHGVDHSYIAFEPTQLKSASGNKGSYDLYNSGLVEAKRRDEISLEAKIVQAHNTGGGSSISKAFGDVTGKPFYSVEVYPDITMPVKGKVLTEQDIYDFRNKALEGGADLNDPHKLIGTWVNEKGDSEIGVAALVPDDLHTALDIAKEYGQKAIWDNETGATIWINGPFKGQIGEGLPSLDERMGFVAAKSRMPTVYETNWKNIDPTKLSESQPKLNDKQIRDSAIRGKEWRDWYTTWDKFMRNDFVKNHPNYHPLFSWFIAATSPHNQVGGNVTAAIKAFRNFVQTGDPSIPLPGQPGIMSTYFPNLKRVAGLPSGAAKEPPTHLLLSGGKVPEFAPALVGDPWAIAVDMHVANVLWGTKEPTDYQRFAGQMAIMRVSKRMGWKPAEVQAAIFADDILKSGKQVARLEDYAEKYRQEFQNLIAADIHRGAPGASIGRGILERASQRVGPERFLRTSNGNIALIRQERYAAIDPELATSISLTGPKLYGPDGAEIIRADEAKGRGTGRSAAGIPTTEFDRRVASAYRLSRLYDGVKHVFWKSPGMQGGGNAVHHQTDLAKKLIGEYTFPFLKWEKDIGIGGKLTGVKKNAINDTYAYYEAKAAGLPLPALSPVAKNLVSETDAVVAKINAYNARLGVKVQHPDTKAWVNIPKIDFPAQIKQSVLQAMRDPQHNQPEWRDLVDWWKAEKILPSSATEADAVNLRDKVLSAYDKNGPFSRLFFHPNMLPKKAMDYSYKSMHEFINAWAERASQVEAYGKTRENDIFQEMIDKTHDQASKNYIRTVQSLAYGDQVTDVYGKFMNSAGQWSSIVHLANWYSATKNLVFGQGYNMAALGPWGFAKAFFQVVPFKAIPDAVEKGVIIRDLMNVMTYGEELGSVRQAVGSFAFKTSLWNAAENWNRGVAFVGTRSVLRHALNSYNKDPRSPRTLRYMAHMQRLGFREGRADDLMRENGKGELTDEYIRQAVNQIHGGYTFADVPVYMSTPTGKALFKYKKWGAEQARFFAREVARPAARTLGLAEMEKVDVKDASGNITQVTVPRSIAEMLPLASYIFSVGAAGAAGAWLLERMFGVRQKIVSLAEALAQYKRGGPKKFNKFIDMVWGYHRLAGSMGALGEYAQTGLVWAGVQDATSGNKLASGTAESIPALDPFFKFGDAVRTLHDQGWKFGAKDVDKLADSIGYYRTGKQLILHQMDVIGLENRYSTILANRQDLSVAKGIQRRYAKDAGYDMKKGPSVPAEKTEISIWREPLDDAISTGDLPGAKAIIAKAKAGMSPARWRMEADKLKDHIRAKQPLDPLGRGAAAKPDFWKWAKANLSVYDQALLHRLDDTYKKTATRLQLGIEFKPASMEDVMRLRHEIKLRNEPVTY